MLNFLAIPIAQVAPANPAPPAPQFITEEQPVRILPGQLDKTPVFNSNSPEVVQNEGILLSTMDSQGRSNAGVHLKYNFSGSFDIFTHHISRPVATDPSEGRQMNLGIVVYNSGSTTVRLDILQSVSYTTTDDAPFQELPAYVNNPKGRFFSGPGSRLATDLLRGVSEAPSQIVIPIGESRVIFNRPIPTGSARSGLMRLHSSGQVQVASIALLDRVIQPHAPVAPAPLGPLDTTAPLPPLRYRAPQATDWQKAINVLPLATPRDLPPTPPGASGSLVYGRVAGVSEGSRWEGFATDRAELGYLSVPERNRPFSYVLNTPDGGTLGTGQVQTARLFVRYPDTAYAAHGNYATHYRLTMPLQNNTGNPQVVTLKLQTPLKDNWQRNSLRFNTQRSPRIFFRGTVQVTYSDKNSAEPVVRSIHIVQRQGERGQPLAAVPIAPGERKLVEVELIYPPDATPPHVLTLESFDPAQVPQLPADRVMPLVELESAPQ